MIDYIILAISFLIVVPITNYKSKIKPLRSTVILKKLADDFNNISEAKLEKIRLAINKADNLI